MLAKLKANVWKNHLMKLTPKYGILRRETKQTFRYKSPNTQLKNQMIAFQTLTLKLNFLRRFYLKLFNQTDIIDNENMNSVETFLNSSLPLSLPVKSFTLNDVKYAILKYSLNKSPGYNSITAEVARSLSFQLELFSTSLTYLILH